MVKMKILIAKNAGFCMGVRRAVEMVLDAPNKHENPICTFGPLIHNPQVLDLLREKEISILEHIPEQATGTVLIRAHGVPPQTKQNLKKAGYRIIDATCPRVIKVQTIIRTHAKKGYASIIIGDKDHPEVIGLLGYAKGKGFVVDNLDDLDTLPSFEKAIIVAQTTQNTLFFEEIKTWANDKFPHYKIFDTICDSTAKRQAEVQNLADSVDAVIVVGGQDSGNTRRLAEISQKTGKPTYHIETESEIDVNALSEANCIGITAGASTPNWVIKKIYRTLEALPYKKKQGLQRFIFPIQRVLLLTNIYVSIGAGCLCYACIKIQGIKNNLQYVLISMLYVLSMHILNNLIGTKADRYNDPDRSSFYDKNRTLLGFLALTAGGIGLMIAYSAGWIPFLILFGMSLMGLSYNVRIIPKRLAYDKYSRLRDIPGSKTVLIAMAWGIVTSVLPQLGESGNIHLDTAIIFLWSLGLVFVRTAFFDILDMQGDRIVGKETIPILVGEKQALRHLKVILAINFGILFVSSAFQLIPGFGFLLLICPAFVFIMLAAHERGYMLPGIRLEFLVESNFVMAGVITLVWSLF
jgi:(E)-4-hydroxy-3-methyl-but-2-enyl pyrophosphate reductase